MPPPHSASSLVAGPMTEPWGSVDDVAAHLGVRKDSIYRWIENRGLPAQKIGKLWKLKLSEVDAWVRTHSTREESPAGASSPKRVKQPRRGSSPERSVLVIEDDELVRETLGDFLSDEDFQPLLASDGAEALKLLGSASPRPGLIILDFGMPNFDGWQFRERQTRDPNLSPIPVIVVTADRRAKVSGAVVLRKPLNLDQLANAIERLLVKP